MLKLYAVQKMKDIVIYQKNLKFLKHRNIFISLLTILFTAHNGKTWIFFYNAGVPLVADMSSDVLSREVDFNKFDFIYGGAQKNVGAAGVTFVVVNKNILGKVERAIPSMLDYKNHIANGSMFNTPRYLLFMCVC